MKIKKAKLSTLKKRLNQMEHDNSNNYRYGHIKNQITKRESELSKIEEITDK